VMASLEERVSRVEAIIEQISERLGSLEQGQQALRQELQAGMRSNFRWTMGVMLAMWITVIGSVLGTLLTR